MVCADAPATASAPATQPKTDAQVVKEFIACFKDKESREFFPALFGLSDRLSSKDAAAEALAGELLKAKAEISGDKAFGAYLDKLVKDKKAPLAAQVILQFARAYRMAQQSPPVHIAVGQVTVDDGKVDPVAVMAQMQILDEGYFVGEIGDLKKPLSFRTHGFNNLDVSLEGKEGEVICLPPAKLVPVVKDKAASLKGKVTADGLTDLKSVVVKLSISVPTPNTPGRNYYLPRPRWPEPITVPVSSSGEYSAEGLSPSEYMLMVSCDAHANYSKAMTFTAGQALEENCQLRSTDVGFYVGAKAPEVKELAWEKDYETALKKAEDEKKPLFIMNTATWCGPCRMLEQNTLSDPWIRYFMSPFVVVKCYEDKKVMETYEVGAFPTLIFADSTGKSVYKSLGYLPSIDFSAEIGKGLKALTIKPTAEMQKLIDKKVISLDTQPAE